MKALDTKTLDMYYFWLCNMNTLWTATRNKLVEEFGSAAYVYETTKEMLVKCPYLNGPMIRELTDETIKKQLEDKYYAFLDMGYRLTHIEKEDYPKRLQWINNKPVGLFYKGKLPDDDRKSVAIVGARACSITGKTRALEFGSTLARHDVQVISGMAAGIDGYAHQGALDEGGDTYAFLGCGVDVCYPHENWPIYQSLKDHGGCISEYAMGKKPEAWHFPMRNRLISGFADAVLVIEAREKSGSLLTAGYAAEQGKVVYALPGRPGDRMSKGCNQLIRDGAGLVSSPEDLLQNLGIDSKITKKNNIQLDNFENMVYATICSRPSSVEELACELNIELQHVYYIVCSLEKLGLIKQIHRNTYTKR